MPFVMVPVPEEHVVEVMRFVIRLTGRASDVEPANDWDQETVSEFFAKANEPSRGVLSYLAHPARAGSEVLPGEVARALQLELSEVSGLLGPLNRQFRKANRVPLFESRVHTAATPSGRTMKRRGLVMAEETAQMVRAAEQALRAVEPDPLVGNVG